MTDAQFCLLISAIYLSGSGAAMDRNVARTLVFLSIVFVFASVGFNWGVLS